MRSYLILSAINGLLLLMMMMMLMLLGLLRTTVGLTAAVEPAAACEPTATCRGDGKGLGYSMRGMFSGRWT
jgi:hypothetical protein